MADNVTIPATGTGTATPVVATDDVSGVHYQYVKLADGAADSSAKIGGDATNGLDVDVTRVPYATKDHDDANAAGNRPVMAGAEAIAHGTNPSAVAAADVTKLYANRAGIQFVIGGHPNVKSATYLCTAATTDDNVLPAISTGTKYVITRITITLDEAATVGVAVRLGFGTANVPSLPAANGDAVDDILVYHPGLVPGGGITIGDGSGILGVGGDGAELRITCEAATGGTLVVTVSYYTIDS